uniref:Jupiter microtubule associated homolog 1 n=1 Tax=Equus caballus TaxID=9796 RepID=A0A5F5PQK0_HORSE
MTTTTTFKGVDPNSRNSSRVLRPPGGGSNFSLGFDEPTEQPVRRNKMASSIFGTPEENPPSWAKSAGAKSSGGREDSESSGPQRRNSSEANSGDFLDLKGEGDIHGESGQCVRSPRLFPRLGAHPWSLGGHAGDERHAGVRNAGEGGRWGARPGITLTDSPSLQHRGLHLHQPSGEV